MKINLRPPQPEDEADFWVAHQATSTSDPNFFHFFKDGMSFSSWLEIIEGKKQGHNLEPGLGPSTFLLAWSQSKQDRESKGDGSVKNKKISEDAKESKDRKIVGRVTIRHSAEPHILAVRGHIGFVVLKEFRKQGIATQILQLSLSYAKGLGLSRVLLTCDENNDASKRTIEKCGGLLSGKWNPNAAAKTNANANESEKSKDQTVIEQDTLGILKLQYWFELS